MNEISVERKSKGLEPRDCILAVKVTAEEKKKITEFATEQSVNVSALVRRLLFDQLQKNSPQIIIQPGCRK